MRIKDESFYLFFFFAHLRWYHNGWASRMGIQYFNRGGYRLHRHPPLAHLQWCHNGWASNILSGGCKYWMLIHYDTIEDGQNKKSHLLFSFLVRIVLFLHFIGGFYLSKTSLRHFIGFIWIIIPLVKRSSLTQISFAYRCVTRYAVFTRVEYATTPRNWWTRYPSWSSNGWV